MLTLRALEQRHLKPARPPHETHQRRQPLVSAPTPNTVVSLAHFQGRASARKSNSASAILDVQDILDRWPPHRAILIRNACVSANIFVSPSTPSSFFVANASSPLEASPLNTTERFSAPASNDEKRRISMKRSKTRHEKRPYSGLPGSCVGLLDLVFDGRVDFRRPGSQLSLVASVWVAASFTPAHRSRQRVGNRTHTAPILRRPYAHNYTVLAPPTSNLLLPASSSVAPRLRHAVAANTDAHEH